MGLDREKIRELRERAGMSQEQAAIKAGLQSRQAWYNIESGYNSNITLETLDKVAKALGVPARSLIR